MLTFRVKEWYKKCPKVCSNKMLNLKQNSTHLNAFRMLPLSTFLSSCELWQPVYGPAVELAWGHACPVVNDHYTVFTKRSIIYKLQEIHVSTEIKKSLQTLMVLSWWSNGLVGGGVVLKSYYLNPQPKIWACFCHCSWKGVLFYNPKCQSPGS